MPSETPRQKFVKGAKKASLIGKGSSQFKPGEVKMIEPSYWGKETFNKRKKVVYLNSLKRKPYKISFVKNGNNLVLMKSGRVFDTEKFTTKFYNYAIFVISPKGSLYAGKAALGKFHHSSFLAGGAVLSAGERQTNSQGFLTFVSNKSGHYKPKLSNILAGLSFFQGKGVDLS